MHVFVPVPIGGDVAWGMTPAYRTLPASEVVWQTIQAGDTSITIHDALAHPNPSLRLAYTRLVLYYGANPNGKDVKGRFGRSPADCIVAHPPSSINNDIARLLYVFGADFFESPQGLMPPVDMARWMQNNDLTDMLKETHSKHPLAIAAEADLFHDAFASILMGRIKRSKCTPLTGLFQNLRLPWHRSRRHFFPAAFNKRVRGVV